MANTDIAKVYISGPITGFDRDVAFRRFALAETYLDMETSFIPVNPMRINPHIESNAWEDNLRRDLPLLAECHGIALLPGWERSRGAVFEHFIATRLGFPHVIKLDGINPWDDLPEHLLPPKCDMYEIAENV